MNLEKKLLTLDIIVLLIIAILWLLAKDYGYKEVLMEYFVPIMLTVYLVGRHLPLLIVKRFLKNQK